MQASKPVSVWMAERGIDSGQLVQTSALDHKVVEAIIQGRYTPSPQQRQRIAAALGVAVEDVAWDNTVPVENLYGHGPQFGRTP